MGIVLSFSTVRDDTISTLALHKRVRNVRRTALANRMAFTGKRDSLKSAWMLTLEAHRWGILLLISDPTLTFARRRNDPAKGFGDPLRVA